MSAGRDEHVAPLTTITCHLAETLRSVLPGVIEADARRAGEEALAEYDRLWATHSLLPICSCSFPNPTYRNGSGHDPSCPVHHAWLAVHRAVKA